MVGIDEEVLDRHVGKESLDSYFSGTQNGTSSHSYLLACLLRELPHYYGWHIAMDGSCDHPPIFAVFGFPPTPLSLSLSLLSP